MKKKLKDYPNIELAIKTDGAIRFFDQRWSKGFVEETDLLECLKNKILLLKDRDGMLLAEPPIRKT